MDPISTFITISTILNAGGAIASAGAKRRQGAAEQQIYEERADKALVAGQQTMFKERHKTDLVASRALALAAASGGSATDPTTLDIIEDIRGEGAYRESVAMYEGEENARILRMGGKAAREESEAKATGYEFGAASSILSGGSSMYDSYKRKQKTSNLERGYG